jgi:hypothetical protein
MDSKMNTTLDTKYFYPQVLQVIPTDDYKVYAYFNDGSVRLFDVRSLIKPDTVFEPLSDLHYFKENSAVINGTVAWDIGGNRDPSLCVDLDPFVIFDQPRVPDPLDNT